MTQLTLSDFAIYDTSEASLIVAGPLALYAVQVDLIMPTQMNEGFAEVDAKAAAFDLFTSLSQVESDLLGDIEPVVIGPGGQLYLLDGHHTFTSLIDSVWGADDPTVYVNVIANYSSDTEQEFIAQMEANNWLLPLNDGVPQTVNPDTGAPIPTSLTGLTSDVYRGLEYSILKEKDSKLFTTTDNISGATGASTPGLDKMPGLYSDFAEAAAYQDANGGLGLPYLSPGDIALATQWNLNPDSTTTLPNVSGTVYAYQLPGFILSQNVVISTQISNATLGQTVSDGDVVPGSMEGAIDGNGTFTGITEINAGTVANPIYIDTPNVGLIMQVGADKGDTVTLSNTNNTYIGGATFLAGTLVIAGDGSLGAQPTETISAFYSSLTFDGDGFPDNVTAAVQADNGIIFNSLSEGNGTLTIGTTAGAFTNADPFTTSRPIAVGNEAATINVNGSYVELNGPLITLGYDNLGIGETDGFPALTIDDLSSGGGSTPTAGTLVLSTPSPYFYGDIIIGNVGTPTVDVMSDAALGATTGNAEAIGEVELNGGTLQTGASFSAPERNIVLDGGSQIDLDGNTTTWGVLTDVKRTIAIGNSSATAGAITFDSLIISQTSTLQLNGSANGTTYSGAETVTFTNGILQSAATDTLLVTSAVLGTTAQLFSGVASATLVNGMAPAWMITDSGGGASTNPYNFLTYGADGYVAVTYTDTGSGSTGGIRTATSTSIVDQTGSAALKANAEAYALKVNDGEVITATGFTITLGDGSDPAGLIMDGGSAGITGGTLAFGGSQAIIYAKGSSTISAVITGTNGLTLAGSGTLTLSTASPGFSGAITIDSGELSLTAANVFSTDLDGVLLGDVKSNPSNSILNFTANQTFTTLNSVGGDSAITFSGATLTIGDTVNNLSSTLSSSIKESGSALSGALTFDGSGLFDLSGMKSGDLSLVSGSTIVVNNSAQLRIDTSEFANASFGIVLNGTSQLQFAQGGGGQFANPVSGTGELHLIGGTLQITGTSNTYSGGTVVETGSTLDITPANLPVVNENITDAGGLVVFDQSNSQSGTYTGVISDGQEMGIGPTLSGSLDKDDSTNDNASTSNLTLTAVQAYSGATYIEAGTVTLDVANAIADSSGVTLGRVGGAVDGQTAGLILEANEQLTSLSDDPSNTTAVVLNGNVLTLAPTSTSVSSYGGTIVDGSAPGSIVIAGVGTAALSGINTFTSGITLDSGTLVLDNLNAAGSGAITFGADADPTLTIGFGDTPTNLIKGVAVGDSIDLQAVGTETAFTYVGGMLTVSGGSQTVQLDIAQPPANEGFVLSADGSGGTLITVATDAGPTITSVAPSTVEKGQTTEIGTVTPGLAGDTLTLQQTGGSGMVSLQLVNGVEEVTYTAPASIPASTIDTVSYKITDEYGDVASGSANVQLDAGPTITSVTPLTVENGQTTEMGTVTPGLAGDTLTLQQNGGSGTVSLQLVSGVEEVIYTAPASIPASTIDTVSYTVTDGYDDVVASGSANVQLDAGPKAGTTSIIVGHNQMLNETALVDGLITPGLAGDTETITQVTGNATLSGQTVTYQSPASGTDSFSFTVQDQLGGTATGTVNITVDPGPTITSKTPSVVENNQTTVIGTVAPGLAGDTLTLQQTAGSGTVSLQLVNGLEEVIFTAPSINQGILDAVSYTITDEHNDVVTGSNTVAVAPAVDAVDVVKVDGILIVGNGDTAIDAQAGNAIILAGGGADVVFAGPSDGIGLGNGNDAVLGGADDTILAGNGNDIVSTGAKSFVTLGSGADTVVVGNNSIVLIGSGQDNITAGADATIVGGGGNDTVYAGSGSTITLGNGVDIVVPGTSNVIKLGNGADTTYGAAGDTITVGAGHDAFVFGLGPGETTAGMIGPVTINNFNPNNDVIEIASTLASWDLSYTALTSSPSHITTDARGDAVIHLDSNSADTITLVGVSPSSLHASDFHFV